MFRGMTDKEEVAAAAMERLACQVLQTLSAADVKKRGPGLKQLRALLSGFAKAEPPVAGYQHSREELERLWRLSRGPQFGVASDSVRFFFGSLPLRLGSARFGFGSVSVRFRGGSASMLFRFASDAVRLRCCFGSLPIRRGFD